jgi:hypothetical protein
MNYIATISWGGRGDQSMKAYAFSAPTSDDFFPKVFDFANGEGSYEEYKRDYLEEGESFDVKSVLSDLSEECLIDVFVLEGKQGKLKLRYSNWQNY